jgi:hypothetical protein
MDLFNVDCLRAKYFPHCLPQTCEIYGMVFIEMNWGLYAYIDFQSVGFQAHFDFWLMIMGPYYYSFFFVYSNSGAEVVYLVQWLG